MATYFTVLTRGLMMLAKYVLLFIILAVTWNQAALASCDYVISNEWNSGFTGAIRITNNSASPINGWNVSWRYNSDRVTSSWNATLTGANPYSAANLSWNGTINPGQVVEFGIQGIKGGGTAEKPVVSGTACNGVASSTASSLISSSASSVRSSSVVRSSIYSSSKSSVASTSAYKGTVYLVGDSTVTNYKASVYPQMGWGQVLPYFFESANVTIDNRAIGGRSSRSFIEEGRWTTVRALLKKGDYVFVQFGHNDRDFAHAERYTSTTDYQTYLRQYVNEARAKGAIPVLVSPMVMNAYRGTVLRNVFTESGNDYRGAMAAIATEQKVPFVDLNLKSFTLVNVSGQNYASHFLYLILNPGEYPNYPGGNNDGTHFQEMGAIEMARLVVEGLEENKTLTEIAPLVGQLKPRYPLTIAASVNGAGLVTQNHNYPIGTPITLKAIVNGSNKFTEWRVAGKNISSNLLTQIPMSTGGLSVQAIFNGVITAASSSTATSSAKASSSLVLASSSKSSTSSLSSSKSSTLVNSSVSSYAPAKILLIGDSTVSTYNSGYYPRTGWGQLLGLFFKSNITVDNRALGGTSSKSFYNNNWAAVKKDIKKGDFVFIQFGINDRNSADPARYAPASDGTFQDYLTRFANETIAMGGTPVFVSTLVRNSWTGTKIYPAYHDHPVATRNLAAQLKVALIDLDAKSTALLESVGQTYSTRFYYMNLQAGEYSNYANGNTDDVHFQLGGALEMARLVVEGIDDNKSLPAFARLITQLQPRYPLTVSSSVANAGVVTRGFNYPVGVTLTLKEIPNGTNKFTAWRIGGSQVSTKAMYETKMITGGISAQAVFNGVVAASAQQKTASVSDALATDVTNICINADTVIDGNGWGWEEDQPCQAQQ